MTHSKWLVTPAVKAGDALKQGLKTGGIIFLIGLSLWQVDLKASGSVLILLGVLVLAYSLMFRKAVIRGDCPACNRHFIADFKEQIKCPFCEKPINTTLSDSDKDK